MDNGSNKEVIAAAKEFFAGVKKVVLPMGKVYELKEDYIEK